MTYNVRGLMGLDGSESFRRVAKLIEQTNADLVALQELHCGGIHDADPPTRLGAELGMQASFVCSVATKKGDYGHALLSRFPVVRIRHEILPGHKGRTTEPRSAVAHEVMIEERTVRVVSTHLALTAHERDEQMNAIVAKGWLDGDDPLVFLGDLNCLPWSRALRVLRGRLQRAGSGSFRYVPTWPAPLPILSLDHIYVSRHFRVHWVRNVMNAIARWASDHVPLLAEVELT